jgi:NADPH-dependent curcumin reductase CurA
MRNRLRPEGTHYISSLEIGKSIISMGIAEVIESKSKYFTPGDIVIGMLPWQEFSVVHENTVKHIQRNNLPITTQLGILGYPGFTAYVGILKIAKPIARQTIFISGAAGAVGSLAGQLAKIQGSYVVGCTSSKEKVDYLISHYHYDAAFNYREYQSNYIPALKHYCDRGIDINFENVGGQLLEAVIECLNPNSTIVLCGAISQYNTQNPRRGPSNFNKLNSKNAKLVGYIVTDYDHLFAEFQQYIINQYQAGKITYHETIIEGLDNAWSAFIDLFNSENIGKMLVAV